MLKKEFVASILDDCDEDTLILVNGTSNYTTVKIPGENTINIIVLAAEEG